MIVLPNLDQLLTYKNPWLIKRYQKDYPNNQIFAEEALAELLKYFWLCQKHLQDKQNNPNDESLEFACAMHSEMQEIDDMWHTFLLFTNDYMEFSLKNFGAFIHHIPTTEEEKLSPDKFEIDFTRYLSYVYDNLGEETVCKWFKESLG